MFAVRSVSHAYGANRVLNDVSFDVVPGKVLGLVGPNGSGKTTLLRTLYGAVTPDSGQVLFDGRDVREIAVREIAQQIAVVVQEPPGDLMHTVADTVLMGRTPHLSMFQRSSPRGDELAVRALERVGALHLASRGLDELSGGERQRVFLARALVQQAHCLLLDEPTNHLDVSFQHSLLDFVRQLSLTTVVVLHDLNLAARYCDAIVMLDRGEIIAQGRPDDVLVPATVGAAYDIDAEPVSAADGAPQLLFRPRSRS